METPGGISVAFLGASSSLESLISLISSESEDDSTMGALRFLPLRE
jgi:hypothetical protein